MKKIKEPISTFTNLAYPAAAFYTAFTQDFQGFATFLLLFTGTFMGIGSSLFHSRLKRNFQAMDEVAMYMYLSSIILFNLDLVWTFQMLGFAIIAVGGLIISMNHRAVRSSRLVLLLATGVLVSSWNLWLAITAGLLFIVALGTRQIGKAYKEKSEMNIPNVHKKKYFKKYDRLHGLWYILSAIAQIIITLN